MSVIRIREADFPDDRNVVQELLLEYAAGVGVDLCFQGFSEEVSTLPGRYARPAGGVWLAIAGEDAAGCVALRPLDAERGEIKRLYVRPGHRGGGVGRILVEQVLHEAARAGYRQVCLDTLPTMTGAINLYRSFGFVEVQAYYPNPVPEALFLGRELKSE